MAKKTTRFGEQALSPDVVQELERLAKGRLGEMNKTSRVLRDEVFSILADHTKLIQYPIQDDEFCAMVCYKRGRLFSVINTNIPYDKQVFAAAHELYHVWYDQDFLRHGEVLSSRVLNAELEPGNLEVRELKANRFAALLLVPTDVLRNELDYLKIKSNELQLYHIVRLLDTFGVPYKTMVRRLWEVGFISADQCEEFLQIPDRDEHAGVLLLQRKMQMGLTWQQRSKAYRLAHMVEDAITAFESEKISYEKLKTLLNYARVRPEDVVSLPLDEEQLSEEELKQLLEEDGEAY